jgi:hypothetical protein
VSLFLCDFFTILFLYCSFFIIFCATAKLMVCYYLVFKA